MNSGTDRDIEKQIVALCAESLTILQSITHNLYGPRITTQPTDATVAIGQRALFTVIAENVRSYKWQVKVPDGEWTDSGSPGNATYRLNVEATEARYTYQYRCKITGLDGTIIYSDAVKMVPPDT